MDLTFPQMGESVTEGTILEWLKQVGDEVEADEGIVEVSTDKVDTEVPAPAAGTVAEILVAAGRDGVRRSGAVPDRARRRQRRGRPRRRRRPTRRSRRPGPTASRRPPTAPIASAATPVAARMASAHGIDIGAIDGSGPRGRVTKADVLASVEDGGAAAARGARRGGPRAGADRGQHEPDPWPRRRCSSSS